MAVNNIILALLALAAAWLLQSLYRLYRHRRQFDGLPKPPHSFLFGHLKVMGEVAATMPPNMHPQWYLTAIAQKYNLKGIFYIDLWPIADSQVVLTDPELMNQVTVTKPLRVHPMADDFLGPIVGRNGIATANGPVWKKTHNAMAPAFSWSHIRSLTEMIADETMLFRDALDRLAASGESFSMEETSAKLVFDVIARIVFHLPLHAQTRGSSYLNDLREMIQLAEAQLSWSPIVKVKSFFRRQIIMRRLHSSITRQIKERLQLLRRDGLVPSRKDPYSILDLMLREQLRDDGPELKGKTADHLAPAYLNLLLSNIKALLVGGHGTTTDTLCYIYMLLSKSPDVVQKLREEHSRIFHPDFDETLNILRESPQKLNDLEYTNAVIQEALRLFPVGFSVREAEQGATLTFDGQTWPIDNHLAVIILQHRLHYDPAYYPDAAEFKPERFLDPDTADAARSCFRTFGRGPRACLGQNLAKNEMKIILLMTVREYEMECADLKPNKTPRTSCTDMDTVFGDIVFQELGLEARPRGGMMMKVRKVSN